MTISPPRATYGLRTTGTPTSPTATGNVNLGIATTSDSFDEADVFYSIEALVVGTTSDFIVNTGTGATTGSTAWTAGTQQVETNTVVAASGITTSGNATVTVTATGLTGSPLAISVPLTTATHTSATLIASALAAGLNANTAFSALLVASSSGADLIVKSKPTAYTVSGTSVNVWPADIANLNVAIANDTCAGITNDATSTSTTAGVATAGCYIVGAGKDFEGNALPTSVGIWSICIKTTRAATVSCSTMTDYPLGEGVFLVSSSGGTLYGADTYTLEPTTNAPVEATIVVTGKVS
jgi:hypothetical protein